jgi:hypothetical protein
MSQFSAHTTSQTNNRAETCWGNTAELAGFSILPEQQVHDRPAAMAENLGVVAPGFFKGVR